MRQLLKDRVFLAMALELSRLSTCARRDVGAIMVDRRHHIIASGYNGPAPDMPHCKDTPCPGASLPSGTGLEACEAIHAEQNALIQCKFPERIDTVYLTDSPCVACVKMLSVTSARRIVFARLYPHVESEVLWRKWGGRLWEHVPLSS